LAADNVEILINQQTDKESHYISLLH